MNMKQSGSWDMTQHLPMPRPTNDDGYFEEMSKVVSRAGLITLPIHDTPGTRH